MIISDVDYQFNISKNKSCGENFSTDSFNDLVFKPDSSVYPGINDKIEELLQIIKKYFEGIENIDDETEKRIIDEVMFKYEELYLNNSAIDDTWSFINICKY